MQRQPVVAGQFYSGIYSQLLSDITVLLPKTHNQTAVATGIISPHAGYVYSGAIAGKLYASIKIPSTILIIGPNHHGKGASVALSPDGEWLTPLGSIKINTKLNSLLTQHVPNIKTDAVAHQFEHSLEVQVPFIQYFRSDASISALCLSYIDFSAVRNIGEGIATAINQFGGEVLIVASSDMTHYESVESARLKDSLALDKALNLNPEGLLHVCRSEHITMCGVVPVAVMLVAARELGATEAKLITYGTSGDITGEKNQVVGYAAVVVN